MPPSAGARVQSRSRGVANGTSTKPRSTRIAATYVRTSSLPVTTRAYPAQRNGAPTLNDVPSLVTSCPHEVGRTKRRRGSRSVRRCFGTRKRIVDAVRATAAGVASTPAARTGTHQNSSAESQPASIEGVMASVVTAPICWTMRASPALNNAPPASRTRVSTNAPFAGPASEGRRVLHEVRHHAGVALGAQRILERADRGKARDREDRVGGASPAGHGRPRCGGAAAAASPVPSARLRVRRPRGGPGAFATARSSRTCAGQRPTFGHERRPSGR